MTLPTCGLGIITLVLQVGLAFTFTSQRPVSTILGTAMHALALALVFHCRAERASELKRIIAAERKLETREQDLIALLIDTVQPRNRALVNSSRWEAMINICVSALVLSASFFGVMQVGQDVVRDEGIMQ